MKSNQKQTMTTTSSNTNYPLTPGGDVVLFKTTDSPPAAVAEQLPLATGGNGGGVRVRDRVNVAAARRRQRPRRRRRVRATEISETTREMEPLLRNIPSSATDTCDNLSKISTCKSKVGGGDHGSPGGDREEFQGLTISALSKLECHTKFKKPKSQLDFYIENNASKELLPYVQLPGKSFGAVAEKWAQEYFNLDSRTASGHDHMKCGKTLEQKSARHHNNGSCWKWQHIEMKHNWDALLLCGLDFEKIKFYIASRVVVKDLIHKDIITGQGAKDSNGIAAAQQGFWYSINPFKENNLKEYFTEISNEGDLIQYLNSL